MSSYIPEEILQEIFSRLPWKTLMRFRCVNKSYHALFDSSKFISIHHELSNIRFGTKIMFRKAKCEETYMIDYKSVSSLLPLSTSSTTMCEFVNFFDYSYILERCKDVKFLCSCNGLVWIRFTYNDQREEYYIWNPTTKEYYEIPMATKVNNNDVAVYGFGYDYKTDNYKLVRVVIDWASRCSDVDVYTLRSNSWRRIQSIPYYIVYYKNNVQGKFFNGALHWLARIFTKQTFIMICFDIANERFEEVAMPETPMPYPEEPLEKGMFKIKVGVLSGCLCLIFHVFNVRVDVWMMQEYGAKESWTKSFSITQENIASSKYLELIWSFENGEILWMVDQGFVLYDLNNKIYRELMLDSPITARLTTAQDHMVSFT